jgi:hypothetical protein
METTPAELQPSILAYSQAVPPRMPSVYYPTDQPQSHQGGPAEDSDDESEDADDGDSYGPRKMLLAVCLAVAVVLIIVILYCMFSPHTLVRGLTRCGWTVYLLEDCTFCDKQMRLLNGFRQYVLCGKDGKRRHSYAAVPPKQCAEIKSYPFWFNVKTGESRVGYQDTAALQKMAQW